MNEVNNIPVLNIKYSETDEWIPIPAIKGTSAYVKSCTSISRMVDKKTQYGYRLIIFDEKKSIGDNSYTGDEIDVWNGIDAGEFSLSVDGISHSDGSTNIALNAVRYAQLSEEEQLTPAEQNQARINIGALAVDASSSANPIMDGTASPGSSNSWAHGDHVHPTDTSRASAAELATYVRPNLLDNWYFVGGGSQLGQGIFPINQQRQTAYTTVGGCIDRWVLNKGSFNVNAFGLVRSTDCDMHQNVKSSPFLGKTVTFSVLTSAGLFTMTATIPAIDPNEWQVIGSENGLRLAFEGNNKGIRCQIFASVSGTALAAKLEIGSTQTLAHQENGAWVLNEIPNWSEQFYLCTTAEKSGILKAAENGTIIPAVAGTDYVVPTALLAKQDKITTSGILKGNGSGGVSEAVAGTDYLTPATNYSPIRWITAPTYNISSSDIGATISVAYQMRNTPITVNLTQAVSSTLPAGTEIAILNYFDSSITITVSGIQVGVNGINGGGPTKLFYSSTSHSFKPGDIYSMLALKKISSDATYGDCWLLTGNVEVVS